jgi:hypothetical protein
MADAADGPGESAGLITEDQIRDAFRANNGRASVRLTRAVARTTMDILFRANCDEHTRLSLVVANQKISGLAFGRREPIVLLFTPRCIRTATTITHLSSCAWKGWSLRAVQSGIATHFVAI